MRLKILFVFALIFSSLPLCAITQELLNEQFIKAIILNHTEEVKSCLIRGADVNALFYDEWTNSNCTGLMHAAKYGYIEIVNLLLDHNTHVNAVGSWGDTPLILAAAKGHTEVAKILLDHHADVNIGNHENKTALMCATHHGHLKTVKLLLEYHALINAVDKNGLTALMHAISNNHDKIVKLLLKKNASVYAHFMTVSHKEKFKSTALTYAIDHCKFKSIELLLKNIIHKLDKINTSEIYHMWDQYILDSLNEIHIILPHGYPIHTINTFRMLLYHADNLPLSRKKLESITAKALGDWLYGEYAFKETVKHLRTYAF